MSIFRHNIKSISFPFSLHKIIEIQDRELVEVKFFYILNYILSYEDHSKSFHSWRHFHTIRNIDMNNFLTFSY